MKAHRQMADMMKKMGKGGMKGMAKQLGAMGGMGGGNPFGAGGGPDAAALLDQAKGKAKGAPGADDLDFDAIEQALSGKGAMPPGLGMPGVKKR